MDNHAIKCTAVIALLKLEHFKWLWLEVLVFCCRWADQCPNAHDKNRLIPAFSYVGQNMADSWSSVNSPERDLAGKVNGWYEEVKKQTL